MYRALVTFVVCSILFTSALAANDVLVKNLKLFVDGKEYIVKGMAYNPAPIGYENKTGLCSFTQTPYGESDYRSHCFDSDYWDGALYPDRTPTAGPSNGWFRSVWERDLPDIVNNLGCNTLRLYNVNPSNLLATQKYLGTHNIYKPLGKDHIPFLDYCQSLGLKVIWPLYSDGQAMLTETDDNMKFFMKTAIEEVGNHPAILMYAIGNELNYLGDAQTYVQLLTRVNMLIDYSRDYQQSYWKRTLPFTTMVDDNNDYYDWLMSFLHVDVFSANAGYRGYPAGNQFDFYNLWAGAAPSFSGFWNLSCYYQKPLLIAELNPIGFNNPTNNNSYPTGFPQMWADLIEHVDQGAIGVVFFEYSDELNKGSQSRLGLVTPQVRCQIGTGCSNEANVLIADSMVRKGWEYDAVCCGAWDGKPYNFKADAFALLGRAQQTWQSTTQPCPANMIGPGTTSPQSTSSSTPTSTSSSSTPTSTSATTTVPGTTTTSPSSSGSQTTSAQPTQSSGQTTKPGITFPGLTSTAPATTQPTTSSGQPTPSLSPTSTNDQNQTSGGSTFAPLLVLVCVILVICVAA